REPAVGGQLGGPRRAGGAQRAAVLRGDPPGTELVVVARRGLAAHHLGDLDLARGRALARGGPRQVDVGQRARRGPRRLRNQPAPASRPTAPRPAPARPSTGSAATSPTSAPRPTSGTNSVAPRDRAQASTRGRIGPSRIVARSAAASGSACATSQAATSRSIS